MDLLDWRYTGPHKDIVQLNADLGAGWRYLEKRGRKRDYWGFDKQIYIPDRSEPVFWCHLYFVALGPVAWESVRTFPGTECFLELGHNSISIDGAKMEVNIPLSYNTWNPTQDSGRLGIYVFKEPLFSITTPEGDIEFRIQLWFVHHSPRSMSVKHQYEWGDGFAWIGGRPESNPRRF
jgi:hypothetical protein